MWKSTLNQTSHLTIELRELIEDGVNIWDFDYDSFYTGDAKKEFEQKVIDHYFFRQIGFETVGRFKHYFKTKVREIMPYYKRLYESVELMDGIEDPFGNVNMTETFTQTSSGSSESSSSGSVESSMEGNENGSSSGTNSLTHSHTNTVEEDKTHKFSNTPQGSITNVERYMTEASLDNNNTSETGSSSDTGSSSSTNTNKTTGSTSSTNTGTASSSNTGNTSYTLTKKGNHGVNTYAHDMLEYRQILINVDMQIIEELNSLFLGVY